MILKKFGKDRLLINWIKNRHSIQNSKDHFIWFPGFMNKWNRSILFLNGSVRRAYRTGHEYNKIKGAQGYNKNYDPQAHREVESKLASINGGNYMSNYKLDKFLENFVKFLGTGSARELKRNRSIGITFLGRSLRSIRIIRKWLYNWIWHFKK